MKHGSNGRQTRCRLPAGRPLRTATAIRREPWSYLPADGQNGRRAGRGGRYAASVPTGLPTTRKILRTFAIEHVDLSLGSQ